MNSFVKKISQTCTRLSLPHFSMLNLFQIYIFNYGKEKNIERTNLKANSLQSLQQQWQWRGTAAFPEAEEDDAGDSNSADGF
jgi:hypothetical protein